MRVLMREFMSSSGDSDAIQCFGNVLYAKRERTSAENVHKVRYKEGLKANTNKRAQVRLVRPNYE